MMTEKDNVNVNENVYYNLDFIIGGKNMSIPIYIAKNIPFFENLISTGSIKDIYLEQSPKFLEVIVEFMRNHERIDYLKDTLTKNFDEKCIKNSLKYYGLDELLNKMYNYSPHRKVNGRYVIDSIKSLNFYKRKLCEKLKLNAGELYTGYVVLHNNGDIFENFKLGITETIKRINVDIDKPKTIVNSGMIWYLFTYDNKDYVIPKQYVIEMDGYYYVNTENYIECYCPDIEIMSKIFHWSIKEPYNRGLIPSY
jgi:hypothetical protein